MRRIVIDRPGGYDRLRLVEDPDPQPAAGEVLIAAEAPRLAEGMRFLLGHFADGRLQPLSVLTFALAQAADARRRIESGQSVGKPVLVP